MQEHKGLIGELNRVQAERGFVSNADLIALSERLRVPLYRLQGLVSFYPHFRITPPPAAEVSLCRDMSCHLAGASDLAARIDRELVLDRAAGRVEVHRVSCLGRCDAAPAACVNSVPLPPLPAEVVAAADVGSMVAERTRQVAAWARDPASLPPDEPTTSPCSWRCNPYPDAASRYGVLRQLRASAAGAEVMDEAAAGRLLATLKEAGLRGMGGAGFPTASKWELVRKETRRPKYVVVNADESEPGTFKDRVILEELPFLVIEGALIAGLVTGAEKGIIYIRHEYIRERRALEREIERARALGLLPAAPAAVPAAAATAASAAAPRTPGAGSRPFDIEIFVSPGGYILGEETALLEALEDRRGEPRNKPPFPVSHGLFGQPTVINNVETLAMVPGILARGADWWKAQGRGDFTGLKFIALSGQVARPGVYEIATGTPIGELIERSGGIAAGRPLAAIAPGGASSSFLPPAAVSVPLDFKAVQDAGSMLGSGAVVVIAGGTDLLDLAANVVAFFRNESCGKCVPCRTGTEKAVRILEDLVAGRGNQAALALLPALGETLSLTSICGLGQVALNSILSVLRHFPRAVDPSRPSAETDRNS
jgi:NADH:ubiquinone oxidoreductase subunit F (NADH-binding)/NADH:ubiquinone oxidoreductase subunit E